MGHGMHMVRKSRPHETPSGGLGETVGRQGLPGAGAGAQGVVAWVGGYRMVHGFLSLKGFSEAGTPTSRGSLRTCCSQ